MYSVIAGIRDYNRGKFMKIELELKNTKKFNKHFKFCVGSGHAPLALRKDYCEQLKFIHDTLDIKRVRFHGIFNDDMNVVRKLSNIIPVPGANRFVDINFSRIGEVYDNVLACGMKPFVELGFMPEAFAKNKNQHVMFYYGKDAYSSMPEKDEEWTSFIKDFVNYLINRYGKEEVESWMFEVWNEPDLVVFFGGSMEDYFHLYEITVKAIKEVDPLILVGGPSTSGSKWINEFLSFVHDKNLPLDFVTTHQYAGDPIGNIDGNNLEIKEEQHSSPFSNPNLLKDVPDGSILDGLRHVFIDKSETKDLRNDTILINSKQTRNVIGNLPLYYTEWNENATFSAYTNDTRKVSAFITMISMKIEDTIEGSSVWCFSDIFEELHMFNEEFHGGFGLLTHHGIPKPSYYALRMLNEVGDERYVLDDTAGEITYGVFKDEEENVQILLTRQNMKNLDLPKIDVEIKITNKEFTKALIQGITKDCGNPLKIYEEMGKPKYLSKIEIENIKNESAVNDLPLDVITNNGSTSMKVSLGINDTYLIKLFK